MSKITMFNTRFWDDSYIANLESEYKLVFIYALTNPRISLCGIYEVPLKNIALDTGLDNKVVTKILERFEKDKRVVYLNGWLCMINYPKHQNYNSPMILTAAKKELSYIPSSILEVFIGYGYPIDTISIQSKDKDKVKDKEQVRGRGVGKGINFDVFWNEYPKKVGKPVALKKWNLLSQKDQEAAVRKLPEHKLQDQWKKNAGQFIPHPATWINQRRWEDEINKINNKPINLSL